MGVGREDTDEGKYVIQLYFSFTKIEVESFILLFFLFYYCLHVHNEKKENNIKYFLHLKRGMTENV